ncbi:stage II sporulation protein P [Bacillus aquiflavi]|uniref:Stage II sporulation protein P n=1 Tax=Bacillus aquiflavi TaxID=2672567 RepID=A0A6B3VXK8_9BACI|nr:stage II sporulation protein P [Bacillus aquiflavi]MBA4535891.1 stage II sporulation protein P [Bacillus aquiflavi]NEY80266.1 stage II sporulation protein P [Bacillus aquiflavi]
MNRYKQSGMIITVHGSSILKVGTFIILFMFVVFLLSSVLTSLKPGYRLTSSSITTAATNITGEMLYQLIGRENHSFLQVLPEENRTPGITKVMFSLSTNVSLDDPRSLLGRELPGFSAFDSQIIVAGEGTNYTNMPFESSPPLEVLRAEQEAALQNLEELDKGVDSSKPETPQQTTGDKQVVYLYFTHNRESFLPYLKGVNDPNSAYHSEVNVTKIGETLKQELEKRGVGTNLDKTDVMGLLNKKGGKFWQAYDESRPIVEAAIAGSRDLQYFIDIHRDSSRRDKTTIEINGESYAKLMFVIGKKHPQYEKNVRLANEMHQRLEKKYPGLSRGVLGKNGEGENGKYNQDLSENAILIEFGGVDNTFEELNRSAAAVAEVFSEFYWQAEQVNKQENEAEEK